jgi:hypothetical protein
MVGTLARMGVAAIRENQICISKATIENHLVQGVVVSPVATHSVMPFVPSVIRCWGRGVHSTILLSAGREWWCDPKYKTMIGLLGSNGAKTRKSHVDIASTVVIQQDVKIDPTRKQGQSVG